MFQIIQVLSLNIINNLHSSIQLWLNLINLSLAFILNLFSSLSLNPNNFLFFGQNFLQFISLFFFKLNFLHNSLCFNVSLLQLRDQNLQLLMQNLNDLLRLYNHLITIKISLLFLNNLFVFILVQIDKSIKILKENSSSHIVNLSFFFLLLKVLLFYLIKHLSESNRDDLFGGII